MTAIGPEGAGAVGVGCATLLCANAAIESGKSPSATMRMAAPPMTIRVRPPVASGVVAFEGRGFMYMTLTTCR